MKNIKRIQRLSYFMQQLCLAVMVAAPSALIAFWLNFERFAGTLAQQQSIPLQLEHIGPLNLILGFLVTLIPLSIVLYGLYHLRALFALYYQTMFFTKANVRHLRTFSISLFTYALLNPVITTLASVVLTMSNPPGQRSLIISVGSNQAAVAFIAAIFMIIAFIMVEGQKLADENAEII